MPKDFTVSDIQQIELRCAAATAGPWKPFVEGRDHTSGSSFIRTPGDDLELSGATAADFDFIAHAREDVPRLLAEVQRLRAVLDATRAPKAAE